MDLKFPKIPFNTSQIYIKCNISGGCKLYLPMEKIEDQDTVKRNLMTFIKRQHYLLTKGNDIE